jgi:hypothetical protein
MGGGGVDGSGFGVKGGGLLLAAIRLLPCSLDPPGIVYSLLLSHC